MHVNFTFRRLPHHDRRRLCRRRIATARDTAGERCGNDSDERSRSRTDL